MFNILWSNKIIPIAPYLGQCSATFFLVEGGMKVCFRWNIFLNKLLSVSNFISCSGYSNMQQSSNVLPGSYCPPCWDKLQSSNSHPCTFMFTRFSSFRHNCFLCSTHSPSIRFFIGRSSLYLIIAKAGVPLAYNCHGMSVLKSPLVTMMSLTSLFLIKENAKKDS